MSYILVNILATIAGAAAAYFGLPLVTELSPTALYAATFGGGCLGYFINGVCYWTYQGTKLQITGYMPPPSTRFARWFYKFCCHIFTWLGVGPVKVIGAENADFDGRGLVLPNHQFALDFAVVGKVTPFSFRQIAKAKEVKNPVLGMLAAWIGTVGVQVEGGKLQGGGGQAIVDAGARILSRSYGSRMLLFPQGKLVFDNTVRKEDYRTGATRILNSTLAQIGKDEPLSVLPMAIHYKRDPRDATLFHRFMGGLGMKWFRRWRDYEIVTDSDGSKRKVNRTFTTYGATVVIGQPIDVRRLPTDPRAAIDIICERTQELLAVAVQA